VNGRRLKIGVLALQGDFDAHRKRVEELGAEVVLVRDVAQLEEVDALILPGGESGTFLRLLREQGVQRLKAFVNTKPAFGTCAGAILLAKRVENPAQLGLGVLDISVRRNAYGRQKESFVAEAPTALGGDPLEMVFIRAPRIEECGPKVEVLARQGNDPVLVRQGKVMAATFHPELSEDSRVHEYFLKLAAEAV
jgi:5'-phosphate synthase pdxT subunit